MCNLISPLLCKQLDEVGLIDSILLSGEQKNNKRLSNLTKVG